jgi:hypothetical protein
MTLTICKLPAADRTIGVCHDKFAAQTKLPLSGAAASNFFPWHFSTLLHVALGAYLYTHSDLAGMWMLDKMQLLPPHAVLTCCARSHAINCRANITLYRKCSFSRPPASRIVEMLPFYFCSVVLECTVWELHSSIWVLYCQIMVGAVFFVLWRNAVECGVLLWKAPLRCTQIWNCMGKAHIEIPNSEGGSISMKF